MVGWTGLNRPARGLARPAWYLVGVGLICCTGCPPAYNVDDADELPPALAAIAEESTLTHTLHCTRNVFNECPPIRPEVGTDAHGVIWTEDRFLFGLLANPFHWPLDCYRGTSPELGPSSYQCCYDGDLLDDASPLAGTFDFFAPLSPMGQVAHFFWDVLPAFLWNCPPPMDAMGMASSEE